MNPATNSMEKLTQMLRNTDTKLKEMGKTPYGARKATEKEQRDMFENLTESKLIDLIERYGEDKVNTWLNKFMPKEEYNA